MVILKKGAASALSVFMTSALVLAACSSSGGNSSSSSTPAPTAKPAETKTEAPKETPKEEPPEIVKIQVTLWDRGNQPAGTPGAKDNVMVKWVNEQLAPLGVEVEYVQIPRAEESTKLTTWLASGDAPDMLLVYDASIFHRYAKQGGLRPLDDLLDQYGDQIKVNNAQALEQAGVVDGVRYAIPAIRSAVGGVNMSIRQDWLDALGMDIPTTIDELTEVLRAFRDKDPGGVGKDKVVPWGLPALNGSGQQTFFYSAMFAFGVNADGVGPQEVYMPPGNYENGAFTSGFATEYGQNFFRWMNQMYQEGILPKEFVTDLNSQNFNQELANGHVGFFDANNPAYVHTVNVRKTAGEHVKYVTVPPLKRPDGTQMMGRNADYGMFIMVPKSSSDKEAAAVVKYLNWMAQPDVLRTLNWGIEGVHWVMENGVRVIPDAEKNKNELWIFGGGDLEVIQQGLKAPDNLDDWMKLNSQNADLNTPEKLREYGEAYFFFDKMVRDTGSPYRLFIGDRPVDEQIGSTLSAYIKEGVSKIIIAKDFDTEYNNFIKGWEQIGGRDWDAEVTKIAKELGYLK